jgi:arylsulfatase A-like enzyme
LASNKCMPIAERFQLAGYNTAAVATNMLLSSVNKEAGHQGFDDGFNTWHGIDYEKPFESLSASIAGHTLMGQLLPKRPITSVFSRLLYPHDIKKYLPHLREGERTTDSTIAYIEEMRKDNRPYFVLAQYLDPHSPYIAPDPIRGSIALSGSRPEGYGANPEKEYSMRVDLRSHLRSKKESSDYAREFAPLADYLLDLYREEVVYFDGQLGRLLEQLKKDERETIVVFVSDHGEAFGEHGNIEHGNTLYNEEILIPFIIAGPGVPESNELSYTPDLVDATYTLLDLAGVSTENVDGQSVVDGNYQERPVISFMTDHVAAYWGNYKLHAKLVYPQDGETYELTPLMLFDLSKDREEMQNVIKQFPGVVTEMEAFVAQRMENDMYPHISDRELTSKQEKWLGELGYTE